MIAGVTVTQRHLANWLLRRVPPAGIRRVVPLLGALASDIGTVRETNQDRVAILRSRDRTGQTFVVAALADGIGGMRDGALCASIAVGHLFGKLVELGQTTVEVGLWLDRAVDHSNMAVYEHLRGAGGSTLVTLLIHESGKAFWSSVGDSRVYLVSDGQVSQISTDDTIAGQLKKQSAPAHEQSKLLQFVGMGEGLEVHVGELAIAKETQAFLTSDGIHFLAGASDWLSALIVHSPDVATCARRLVDVSKWCGGQDNASVVALPLDVDFSADPAPLDPCIEVWDSFGEVRFLVEEVSTLDRLSSVSNRADAVEATSPKNEASPQIADPTQELQVGGAKKKKERTSRASKTKTKAKAASRERKKHDKADEGEGQVVLEFHDKPE